eukprot:2526574-Alexandrium_andersonii.AAC.1
MACLSVSVLVTLEMGSWTPLSGSLCGSRVDYSKAVGLSNDCRAVRSENMRNCLKRSKLKLRGPETASTWIPEALGGCILCR